MIITFRHLEVIGDLGKKLPRGSGAKTPDAVGLKKKGRRESANSMSVSFCTDFIKSHLTNRAVARGKSWGKRSLFKIGVK